MRNQNQDHDDELTRTTRQAESARRLLELRRLSRNLITDQERYSQLELNPDYPTKDGLRVETLEHSLLRWINLKRPGNAEITWLNQQFEINPLHLDDIASRLQRPKIDDYEAYLFIVLHFPIHNKAERVITSTELDIFLGPNDIVTVHDDNLSLLNRLFEQCKNVPGTCDVVLGDTASFALYQIIDVMVDNCFPILYRIAAKLEELDEEIFKSLSSGTVHEISMVRRDIIAFRRIIKPQITVIANLERHNRIASNEHMGSYYSDIKDHITKIWDTLEEYKDIIEGLSATYDSLSSHRLNQVIKALTLISVMLLPLTLITGLYGMNVPLPFSEEPSAFTIIMLSLVGTADIMVLIFRLRKWF
ncbi:MAG: magnesium transporter CorA family protein [Chloroflexota bacterium]|nr:magnesium transporter CorA family protein [Chloroflexota bacterium]